MGVIKGGVVFFPNLERSWRNWEKGEKMRYMSVEGFLRMSVGGEVVVGCEHFLSS